MGLSNQFHHVFPKASWHRKTVWENCASRKGVIPKCCEKRSMVASVCPGIVLFLPSAKRLYRKFENAWLLTYSLDAAHGPVVFKRIVTWLQVLLIVWKHNLSRLHDREIVQFIFAQPWDNTRGKPFIHALDFSSASELTKKLQEIGASEEK